MVVTYMWRIIYRVIRGSVTSIYCSQKRVFFLAISIFSVNKCFHGRHLTVQIEYTSQSTVFCAFIWFNISYMEIWHISPLHVFNLFLLYEQCYNQLVIYIEAFLLPPAYGSYCWYGIKRVHFCVCIQLGNLILKLLLKPLLTKWRPQVLTLSLCTKFVLHVQ